MTDTVVIPAIPAGSEQPAGEQNQNQQQPGGEQNQQPGAGEQRPEFLLEKFSSVEEQAKAYSELEKQLGKKNEEGEGTPGADDNNINRADVQSELEKKGLDLNKYEKEYLEKGHLSGQSYEELLGKGFTAAQVDDFIDGRMAVADAKSKEVFDLVGGKENLTKLIGYAETNLDPAQIEAYNNAVNGGDYATVGLIVKGLASSYAEDFPAEPVTINGGKKPGSTSGDIFTSMADYQATLMTPRYKTDPAFHAEVEARLERSTFWRPI